MAATLQLRKKPTLDLRPGDRLRFSGNRLKAYRRGKCVCQGFWREQELAEAERIGTLEKDAGEGKKYPPIPAGAKWITVNPSGVEGAGVPILIMPQEDGTATVIGGADGKLNLLKLNSVKTPEQWKEAARERKLKKREKEKARQEGMTDEQKQQEKEDLAKVKEYKQTANHQNALKTLDALDNAGIEYGLTPEHKQALQMPPDPGADADKIAEWQRLTKEATQQIKAIHQAYEQKLITDHDARSAAMLADGDLETDNRVVENQAHTAATADGNPISEIMSLPGGTWMVRGADGPKTFDNWKDAAKEHVRNVLQSEQQMGVDRTQPDSFYSPTGWVKDVKPEQLPEGFEFKPEAALEIAKLSAERKAIDRQSKDAEDAIKKRNPAELGSGFDMGPVREIATQEVAARLEQEAKLRKDAFINNRFLELIKDQGEAKQMRKHYQVGGYSGLAEVASEVLKQNPISRALVDALGHNESAKVLAYMMRQQLTPTEYDRVTSAIAAYHAQTSTNFARGATKQTEKLQERLAAIHEEMLALSEFAEGDFDPLQQLQMDSLAYEADSLKRSIQEILGTTLGKLQATAAMVAALEAKPKTLRLTGEHAKKLSGTLVGLEDPAAIPAPTIDPDADQGDGFGSDVTPGLLEAYGLTAEDLKTFDGPDGPMLQINESGLQKLAVGYNPEDTEAYDRAIAIKRGDMDEADFVPEGFSHYTAVINSDPLTDAQQFDTSFGLLSQLNTDPANVSDDAILDSIRQFIGARVANGDSALQVQNDILSPSFYASQGMEPYGEGANRVRELANKLIVDLAGETNDQGSLVIRDQAVRQAFQDLGDREADRYRQVRQTDDLETLRKQTIPDREIATEALHRTLAAMPMYRTVFTPYEQLSGKEKKWLRNQAITKMMGWDIEAGPAQQRSAVAPTQSQPVYEMGSLFGGPSLTTTQHAAIERVKENLAALDDAWQQRNAPTADDQERHNAKRQALLNQIQQIEAGNLDADEILDEPEDLTQWQLLGKLVGGEDKAIAAVRDMLRGEVLQRFANAYGAISGKPMMIGSEEAAHMDRVELAKLPEAARKEMMDAIKSRQASEIASVRDRAAGGQWTKDPDLLAKFEALKGDRRQMSLFTTEETQSGASLKTTRTTLGSTAEAQLHEIAQKVLPNFQQINDPVDIYQNVNWGAGTQHATKQRALKFLETQKRAGIHFGAGCVHGSTLLRCEKTGIEQSFAAWWQSGDMPWVKALDEKTGAIVIVEASPVFVKGHEAMYRVVLENGSAITVTAGHRFLCFGGWRRLGDLTIGSAIAVQHNFRKFEKSESLRRFDSNGWHTQQRREVSQVGVITKQLPDTGEGVCTFVNITHIEPLWDDFVFDITVPVYHNYLAHGILNHNSGKSSIMLGCFSHLHAQGKVNKMVVAVPSSIVGQFIGESATFLQPGKYNYTANLNMNREDRLKALADPDNHIFVTTRESLANDLLHLVEKHSGVTADQYRELPEDRQKELMLSSAKKEGIDAEKLLLSVDEAHDVTARGNLDPSKRSLALNHLGHHAGYYLQATGDAIKNDLTEMYHFLHSVAPDKFNDQKKFMAEYGQNTSASKRALQRAIAPYSFSASTKPQDRNGRTLKMNEYQPTLDVSDRIAGERQRILDDLSLLSDWQSQRREQLKAEKGDDYRPTTADFNSAWEVPAIREALDRLGSANTWGALDEAGKQQAIGGQIMAIGGLKRTALFRLYHLTPYEDNPKMQWTVEHAVDKFKQEGKPGIVFSSSSVAAEEMVRAFEQKGMRVAYIHGGLSSQEKDIERNKFQSKAPQADILICTDAARTGVNLTRGKVLYHYDVPLTEMGYSQRSARIHRLKQDTDTEIYTPTLDTPEEKMALSRMERKGNIAKPIKAKSERLDDTGLARFIREGRSLRRA